MTTSSRVKKYKKLRQDIAQTVGRGASASRANASETKPIPMSSQKANNGIKSTIEYDIEEILDNAAKVPGEDERKPTPIELQKRKELIRIILLIALLLVILTGVVILGFYAF